MRIFPVIQTRSIEWVAKEIDTALAGGVDGIFLIDLERDHDRQLNVVTSIRSAYPDLYLGTQLIGLTAIQALGCVGESVDALWTENAGITPDGATEEVENFNELKWSGTHFGGIAFKYQAAVSDQQLPLVARQAGSHVAVPTTSGAGTGKAASLEKVRTIRQNLHADHRLALASGITAENAPTFAKYVTDGLISSFLTGEGGAILPSRLAELNRSLGRVT